MAEQRHLSYQTKSSKLTLIKQVDVSSQKRSVTRTIDGIYSQSFSRLTLAETTVLNLSRIVLPRPFTIYESICESIAICFESLDTVISKNYYAISRQTYDPSVKTDMILIIADCHRCQKPSH